MKKILLFSTFLALLATSCTFSDSEVDNIDVNSDFNLGSFSANIDSEQSRTYAGKCDDRGLQLYWHTDDCISALKEMVSLRAAGEILEKQYALLLAELVSTTQRVNLFEKIKIPECKENIRRIRIYMSDQETGAVARSKIAKKKGAVSDGQY